MFCLSAGFFINGQLKCDGPVKSHYDTNVCHSHESGNPGTCKCLKYWIPAPRSSRGQVLREWQVFTPT